MSVPPSSSPGRKAASWFNAGVLAFALTACCVLGVLIATRAHHRFDVTATREHDLSPRTRQLLGRLDRDLTLVVAADLNSLDSHTYQRTRDVLEQFGAASKRLKVNLINTSESGGQKSYEQVLADLAARERTTTDAATTAVSGAAAKSEALAATLESVQRALQKLREQHVAGSETLLNPQYLQTQSGTVGVALQDLRTAATNAKSRLASPDPLVPVPAIDRAVADLKKPVADASQTLAVLADAFDSLSKDPRASEQDKAAAGLLLPQLRAGRDTAGKLAADLAAIDIPRVLRIARGLQQRRAALLIDDNAQTGGGRGIVAIDADELLAAGGAAAGGQSVDRRARTEDLVGGAIATLTSGVRPVVCIVHSAPYRLATNDWAGFQRVREQLSMRGIEFVEWATVLERDIPTQVAVDSPARPVVFVSITVQGGAPQSVAAGIASFSKALNFLTISGRNVLLSVRLSQVPASGSPDPLTECLAPLGIEVDSGRPLLQTEKVATRLVARPRQDIMDPHAAHAISGAISNLRLHLQWPVAISTGKPADGVRVEPIVTIPADGTIWAESEWQEFNRAVSQAKGDYTGFTNPPAKDSPRDGSAPGAAWTLAVAVEHTSPDHPRQRLVVVGANAWFIDDIVDLQASFDGRTTPVFPGNLQLFESAVHWLAGQDDQILRGATASRSATIPLLSGAAQSWLRWLLIAIMPALALAAGLAYRALRP